MRFGRSSHTPFLLRIFCLLLYIFLLLSADATELWSQSTTVTPNRDPYSHKAIAAKNYHGLTLNVLTLNTPVLGEPTVLHAREFEKTHRRHAQHHPHPLR